MHPPPDGPQGVLRRMARPSPRDVLRHLVDGAAPPVTFVVLTSHWDPRWAALVALLVAFVIAALRHYRGESKALIAVSTAIVAMHSATVLVVGEGRAFYLPELVINAAGLVVCAASLAVRHPITAVVCRRLGLEPATFRSDPAAVRRHWRLTAGWCALWAVHLVPLVTLYVIDSLVGLTILTAFFNRPTLLAMAVVTVVVVRRGVRAAETLTTDDPAAVHERTVP